MGKFAVPEECVATAAIYALDIHAERHNDLIVTIGGHVILDTHFNGLVRNLDHLEVVLHLLLEELMVQNHDATGLHSAENVVAGAPSQVHDGLLRGADRWQSLPTLVVAGRFSTHHLALPHDDEAVLRTTTQDTLLLVVGNRVDFVVEELSLEGRLVHGQMVVLISLNVEQADDALSRDSGHQTLTNPNRVQEFGVTGHSQLHFAVGHELLGQIKLELDKQEVRCDYDDAVLLLIEEDVFDGARHFANLRTVLQVIGEADRTSLPTEEEEGVDVVDARVLIDHQRAEDDLRNRAWTRVLADRRHASVRSPHTDSAVDVTGDHTGSIVAEGDFFDWGMVHALNIISKDTVLFKI